MKHGGSGQCLCLCAVDLYGCDCADEVWRFQNQFEFDVSDLALFSCFRGRLLL